MSTRAKRVFLASQGVSMADSVTVSAHAKINLFLRVLSRESTGFHGIETLLCLVDLADELTVQRISQGGEVELDVEGGDTGPAEDNLAVRAARQMLEATGARFGVRIHLKKNIPIRAGLGGGSSDAAATLHAVNALADGAVPRHELLQLAAKLGSDIPFLASGAPMALAWNRGERMFRVAAPPPGPTLLAVPPVGISTAEAYEALRQFQPDPLPRGSVIFDAEAMASWGGIGRLGGNDFEPVVRAKEPRVLELFERVAGTGPLLVRMSGSGSAIVAIYRSDADLANAVSTIGHRDQTLIQTTTRSSAAPGPVAGKAPNV